jgi:hypothetical protein
MKKLKLKMLGKQCAGNYRKDVEYCVRKDSYIL